MWSLATEGKRRGSAVVTCEVVDSMDGMVLFAMPVASK